ncbi:hypothetical protein FGB62_434g00 [Gracilaria domingensis]|nr:hypothetical protein FGB62_434g00 [Gracilaria domingensis]
MTPAEVVSLNRCACYGKSRKKSDYSRRPDILSFCLPKVPGGLSPQKASAKAVSALRKRHNPTNDVNQGQSFVSNSDFISVTESVPSSVSNVPWRVDTIIDLVDNHSDTEDDFVDARPKSIGFKRVIENATKPRDNRKEESNCGFSDRLQKFKEGPQAWNKKRRTSSVECSKEKKRTNKKRRQKQSMTVDIYRH